MEASAPNPADFFHVRVVVGVIAGLAITRILNGLARFTTPRKQGKADGVHIAWAIFVLLLIIHFWWFEFALGQVRIWTFELYAFLIVFAALHFFVAAVLFPDRADALEDPKAYFLESRSWFFGLLIALLALDLADTAIKGVDHIAWLGVGYIARQTVLFAIALFGLLTACRAHHAVFSLIAIASEVLWIGHRYIVLEEQALSPTH